MGKVDAKFDDYQNMTIKDVEVKWAKVQPHQFDQYTPKNAPAGPKKWAVDIVLNDTLAKALKKEGFNVKKGTEGNSFVHASKNKKKKDGTDNMPIKIVGMDGRTPVTDELGNGTKCNIKVSAKKWGTVSTITLYLDSIQVLDLVKYEGGSGFEDLSTDDEPDNF